MIKGIMSTSQYISVGSSNSPYFSMSTPSAGMMRYNGNSSSVEIYDGSYWQQCSSFQDINLTPRANEILDWAFKKMQLEQERNTLAQSNNAVRLALDKLEEAEQELNTVITLAKSHATR